MSTLQQHQKEIGILHGSLIQIAQWFGREQWKLFCRSPIGMRIVLRSPSSGYLRHAEHLFWVGFESSFFWHTSTSGYGDYTGYMEESWKEGFTDEKGNYIGNVESLCPLETVPYQEAQQIFRLGENAAIDLSRQIATPFCRMKLSIELDFEE